MVCILDYCGNNSKFAKVLNYAFHILIIILFPFCEWRFFLRYNDYDFTFFVIATQIGLFLTFMAYMSHAFASKECDPGYVEWHHFRTQE